MMKIKIAIVAIALATFFSACSQKNEMENTLPKSASAATSLVTVAPDNAPKPIEAISIQTLTEDEAPGGAGTEFYLAESPNGAPRPIFTYTTHDDEPEIKINNKLIKLKLIKREIVEKGTGKHSIGEHVVEQWGNGELTATFDFQTVSGGKNGVKYQGKLDVKMGNQITSARISGGFGD
jgi:hypothetical protein